MVTVVVELKTFRQLQALEYAPIAEHSEAYAGILGSARLSKLGKGFVVYGKVVSASMAVDPVVVEKYVVLVVVVVVVNVVLVVDEIEVLF